MLKLRIDSRALAGPWKWTGQRWVNGESWLEPFAHPSLEQVAYADSSSSVFAVRERTTSSSVPGDFTTVTVDALRHRVQISAGAYGTAPVFARERDGVLHASWDLADLPLDGTSLNEREVARLLTMRFRYTAETVFSGVYRVTERATVQSTFAGALQVRYPEPALHSSPRDLAAGADVIDAYERLLSTVIAEHVYAPDKTMVELSGGVDSANVALSLAARPGGHLVRPGSVILDGDRGRQQIARRRELIRACGFTTPDITVNGTDRPPLHPRGQRGGGARVSPYDEPYHEAMSELQRAIGHDVKHVFTGIGGDEMVSVNYDEMPAPPLGSGREFMPWITGRTRNAADAADEGIAPASRVNEMTLFAAGCAAPIILTSGSWPVHPFADPRMITFGEWLPLEWRYGKRLHRERLLRRGLSPRIAHPPVPEVFTGIMHQGLRDHGARLGRQLAQGGHLTGSGYVDGAKLAQACDRISEGTFAQRDLEVYDVLALELAIGTLTGDSFPVG